MRRIVMLTALLALALPVFTQQPFEEQIEVNAVLLDVIVTDDSGNQILGLTKNDFVVEENGVAQEVESVSYLTNRQLLDAREGSAPFQVERVQENRYFIFFFDKPEAGALFDQLAQARRAVRDFIRDEMKAGDLVAIAGHDVRLKIYSDFTSDKAALERALNASSRFGPGIMSAKAGNEPSLLRNIARDVMSGETGTVYEALTLLADSAAPIRARKNLVLFSPGMADLSEEVRNGTLWNRSRYVDPMLDALNAANVSVYSVQLQRPSHGVSTTSALHQRLTELATSTGGHYFQFNSSFKPVIEAVEETNAGYYLVSYRSQKPRGEKGFQKVSVDVRNPEFKVTARSGYGYGG